MLLHMPDTECEDHNVVTASKQVELPVQVHSGGAYKQRGRINVKVHIMHCSECNLEPEIMIPEGVTISDIKDVTEKGDILLKQGHTHENHPLLSSEDD